MGIDVGDVQLTDVPCDGDVSKMDFHCDECDDL